MVCRMIKFRRAIAFLWLALALCSVAQGGEVASSANGVGDIVCRLESGHILIFCESEQMMKEGGMIGGKK